MTAQSVNECYRLDGWSSNTIRAIRIFLFNIMSRLLGAHSTFYQIETMNFSLGVKWPECELTNHVH